MDALLALQVPLAATNGDGNNALWLACVNGEPGLIRALAARGVPIDHANLTGATALMYAASSGKAEVVATLLALGANPALVTQGRLQRAGHGRHAGMPAAAAPGHAPHGTRLTLSCFNTRHGPPRLL